MYALRVMERCHTRLLGVVSEKGLLLGLVSEQHILQAWGEDPLLPVGGVMALCAKPVRLGRGLWRRAQEAAEAAEAAAGWREQASGI